FLSGLSAAWSHGVYTCVLLGTRDTKDDLPWQMGMKFNNRLNTVDLYTLNNTHPNIPKIREGRLAAQVHAPYVPCETQYKDAARQILELIDVIHRMCMKYPEAFMFPTSSKGESHLQKMTASLIGVDGGHSLDSSLGTLRTMYHPGLRYLTLTHDNWLVDSGAKPSQQNGLSEFGKQLIFEMNRIGMLIDLAHVSEKVMNQVLDLSKAPVIFSHSSAYTVCPHKRNVPDDVLRKGRGLNTFRMHCIFTFLFIFNLDHFDHIKTVAGHSIVGFGEDYDGVGRVSEFLEDVSKYPALVAELLSRGWTDAEVKAALGDNLLSVFREVEHGNSLRGTAADDLPIPYEEVKNDCRTSYGYPVPNPDSAGTVLSLSSLALALTLSSLLSWQ
uniref:Dipeptidase n=1 Tax=Salmo trutta TaxID=8032 RepID=A0A673X6U7_SALTR